ncbi:hypothetical protein Droror1_Dr00012761 [Drosera rotundifolia]
MELCSILLYGVWLGSFSELGRGYCVAVVLLVVFGWLLLLGFVTSHSRGVGLILALATVGVDGGLDFCGLIDLWVVVGLLVVADKFQAATEKGRDGSGSTRLDWANRWVGAANGEGFRPVGKYWAGCP